MGREAAVHPNAGPMSGIRHRSAAMGRHLRRRRADGACEYDGDTGNPAGRSRHGLCAGRAGELRRVGRDLIRAPSTLPLGVRSGNSGRGWKRAFDTTGESSAILAFPFRLDSQSLSRHGSLHDEYPPEQPAGPSSASVLCWQANGRRPRSLGSAKRSEEARGQNALVRPLLTAVPRFPNHDPAPPAFAPQGSICRSLLAASAR